MSKTTLNIHCWSENGDQTLVINSIDTRNPGAVSLLSSPKENQEFIKEICAWFDFNVPAKVVEQVAIKLLTTHKLSIPSNIQKES